MSHSCGHLQWLLYSDWVHRFMWSANDMLDTPTAALQPGQVFGCGRVALTCMPTSDQALEGLSVSTVLNMLAMSSACPHLRHARHTKLAQEAAACTRAGHAGLRVKDPRSKDLGFRPGAPPP